MVSSADLMELARHLKQEHLFVSAEKENLQLLNEKVAGLIEKVYHISWISRQQKVILDQLIHAKYSPNICCRVASALENVSFCDSYKQLNFHDTLYGDFLQKLRENPHLLAMSLICAEKSGLEISSQVNVILTSIYANCVLYDDELYVLKLLKHLIEFQLATSDTPRQLLRHGSCSFSHVYRLFSEGLFSAKIFLTAALHAPILNLLMEDDLFLDIDPKKTAVRYSKEEQLKRFGVEGTPEYEENLKRYRQWTIGKLVNLTNKFIASIKQSMYCFPQSLSWLIKQVYDIVMTAGRVDQRYIGAMCADLLFTLFICPAIVNPEPYSITTDMPISYVARFNLMQVAQILQSLAMSKWEELDPRLMDLYNKFDKDCMSSLLDMILEGSTEDLKKNTANLPGLSRSAVLVSKSDLMKLVQFLREILSQNNDERLDTKLLKACLGSLPVKTEGLTSNKSITPPSTPSTIKKSTLNRGKGKPRPLQQLSNNDNLNNAETKQNAASSALPETPDTVLVVSINFDHGDCPGMLSVEKVLMDYNRQNSGKHSINSIHCDDRYNLGGGSEIHEKRTRFSLSHDQDSIGNASDNLEAISEAASNHSVDSSIELENENGENDNDNFSDMVSANVSGRGTPNVSGRDTPSSQIEGEQNRPLDLPVTAQKQNREDIEDRFGKFEIKQLAGGDETVSMVSDTWSTDVLASDSENIEQAEPPAAAGLLDQPPGGAPFSDFSETASDAWSTDVMPSDTERLQEVDTDDTGSVTTARSDDTARSEVDVDIFVVPSASGASASIGVMSPNEAHSSRLGLPTSKSLNGSRRDDHFAFDRIYHDPPSDLRRKHPSNSSRASSASADVPSSPKYQILPSEGFHGPIHEHRKENDMMAKPMAAGGNMFNADQPLVSFNTSENADYFDFQLVGEKKPQMKQEVDLLGCNEEMQCHQPVSRSPFQQSNDVAALFDPLAEDPSTASASSTQKLRQDFADIRLSTASSGSSTSVGDGSKSSGSFNEPNDDVMRPSDGLEKSTRSKSGASEQSYDMMDDKNMDDGMDKGGRDKDKRSFFRNLKFTFKNKNKKFRASDKEDGNEAEPGSSGSNQGNYCNFPEQQVAETGEDILAKYRKKDPESQKPAEMPGPENSMENMRMDVVDGMLPTDFDNRNPEASFVFHDAKRKLRMVLGSADIPMLPSFSRSLSYLRRHADNKGTCDNELVAFLKILLAEATNLEQRSLVAQLHEAVRCVQSFDRTGCKKLFKSLREDYKKRSPYIAYLMKSRQGLLSSIAHLERTYDRIQRDKMVCNNFMISMCVRLFLNEREELLQQFINNFQTLTVPDEKTESVENFLDNLYDQVNIDPFWMGASQSQIDVAAQVIERDVMSKIYNNAMYPNSDGDVDRDNVFHKHMELLAKVITPNNKYLRIPTKYQNECPWPSAQAEIITINAYKTPKDKLQCVCRCCKTIMNLLSMVSEKCVPAADDLMPVLVYVLIKANPSSLLSTVQYVNSFYDKRLEGEESYWWTQFASAIEFIKTMN